MTNSFSISSCFNIRSIGSLWSSSWWGSSLSTDLSFNIRSIGSLWSSKENAWILFGKSLVSISALSDHFGHHQEGAHLRRLSPVFQYPLYRITLVIRRLSPVGPARSRVSISALSDHFGHPAPPTLSNRCPPVSISALSDHFGHPYDPPAPKPPTQCFNIRSIGSLWSSAAWRCSWPWYHSFNIRSIGSLWSSTSCCQDPPPQSSFNIRSIGSLWSSTYSEMVKDGTKMFQYPLYRITLVITLQSLADTQRLAVSISALSDHFGHLLALVFILKIWQGFNIRSIGSLWSSLASLQSLIYSSCFNIRSIGSLWSSNMYFVAKGDAILFQYPLYRITLVISGATNKAASLARCFNIRSIGSLWSSAAATT